MHLRNTSVGKLTKQFSTHLVIYWKSYNAIQNNFFYVSDQDLKWYWIQALVNKTCKSVSPCGQWHGLDLEPTNSYSKASYFLLALQNEPQAASLMFAPSIWRKRNQSTKPLIPGFKPNAYSTAALRLICHSSLGNFKQTWVYSSDSSRESSLILRSLKCKSCTHGKKQCQEHTQFIPLYQQPQISHAI